MLADLTRNTPEEFRGALDGLSRLSANLADRDGQINSLLGNLKRVSTVLDARDEDIIKLMDDADVLFEALLRAPRAAAPAAGLHPDALHRADRPDPRSRAPTSSRR